MTNRPIVVGVAPGRSAPGPHAPARPAAGPGLVGRSHASTSARTDAFDEQRTPVILLVVQVCAVLGDQDRNTDQLHSLIRSALIA